MVVESLHTRTPHRLSIPSPCWTREVGVAVPGLKVLWSLDERRREGADLVSCQLVFQRNARIMFSFSCTEVILPARFLPVVLLK